MSPVPESLQERYAAIERVYAQQDWPAVESRSQALLADLPDEPTDPLRQRLVLLLAHTRLYGTGDPGGAAVLYQAVADAQPEAVLADIAAQGLQQCAQLKPPPATATPATQSASGAARQASPAMPWLQELGTAGRDGTRDPQPQEAPSPFQHPQGAGPGAVAEPAALEPVEVIEEPELIELALADPGRQDQVTVDPSSETPPLPLRWPFMADHEDRRRPGPPPGDPSPQVAARDTQRLEPNPQAPGREIPDDADELLGVAQPVAGENLDARQPNQLQAPASPRPYGPDELAELSQGLLGVAIR